MRKGELTEARILHVAAAMACEHGLANLHLQPLATRVGMTKSGLYAHFGSKEALQMATVAALAQRFLLTVVAPSKQDAAGCARLMGIMMRWLEWPMNAGLKGSCPLLAAALAPLGSEQAGALPAHVRERLSRLFKEFRSVLLTMASSAVRLGELQDLEPNVCVHALIALRFGHQLTGSFLQDPVAEALTSAACRHVLGMR